MAIWVCCVGLMMLFYHIFSLEIKEGLIPPPPVPNESIPLICRLRVKVVVRDVMAARSAYGPYVTPVSLDMGSPSGEG